MQDFELVQVAQGGDHGAHDANKKGPTVLLTRGNDLVRWLRTGQGSGQ